MNSQIENLKQKFTSFPNDVPLALPEDSHLKPEDLHFLIYIPWSEKYIEYIPEIYRDFFKQILPFLSARTTDVHTAICLQYLDEFIQEAEKIGKTVDRDVIAFALLLHDSGWSQMSEEEIAASLGVTGLALTKNALGPKEKHAVLGEKIARKILFENQEKLSLTNEQIELICKAIRFHDKPKEVAGSEIEMPIEVQLLVDLDHVWSFTHFNFWQDVLRKGVSPTEYLKNLRKDLDSYFVTDIGKAKAISLLKQRELEVISTSN